MKTKIYLLKDKLGIDKAIIFTGLSKIVQGFGGLVSVILVATNLNGVEQGFYYTFASILAVQIFFELGLNGIITQFVAHEVSHLKIVDNHYEGNDVNLSRLSSLLHFTFKWFSLLSIFVLILLIITGFIFFKYNQTTDAVIDWQVPWILLSLGTTLNFILSPTLAFIEGLGKVKEIAKIRLIQQLGSMLLLWGGLSMGLKLYVGGISSIFGAFILFFFLVKLFWPTLSKIYNQVIVEKVSYRLEIFPLQWKIALSWVGGYFIFQLFNPVLFAFEGPVVAGQMGMTLSILNAILALSFAWVSTKVPFFSGCIAQKNFSQLDKSFNKTFIQSSLVNMFAMIMMLISIFCLRHFNILLSGKKFGDKFLPFIPLIFMMISFFINHIIGAWAVYLRCHKKEPLLIHSLVYGGLSCISTFYFGKNFGVLGITAGYFCIAFVLCIWAYNIFITKKKLWHFDGR